MVLEHTIVMLENIAAELDNIAAAFKGRLIGSQGEIYRVFLLSPNFRFLTLLRNNYFSSVFFEDPSCTKCSR